MQQLIKALPAIVNAGAESPEVLEAAAIAAWKHVAGDLLSKQTAVTRLEGKKLVVAVADAVWKKQLESMSTQLLARLNSILGRRIVTWIEFRIDSALLTQPVQPKLSEDVSDNDVSLEIWSAANAIEDKQLRKAFLKAATVSLRRTERES
jgi:predicted nucleic acid-binding Zn ribbon protein